MEHHCSPPPPPRFFGAGQVGVCPVFGGLSDQVGVFSIFGGQIGVLLPAFSAGLVVLNVCVCVSQRVFLVAMVASFT